MERENKNFIIILVVGFLIAILLGLLMAYTNFFDRFDENSIMKSGEITTTEIIPMIIVTYLVYLIFLKKENKKKLNQKKLQKKELWTDLNPEIMQ